MYFKFFCFFTLLLCTACHPGVYESNKGTWAVRQKDFVAAQEHYINALLEAPNFDEYRYNLSIANMANERLSDALKELNAIEEQFKQQKITKKDHSRLFKLYFATAFVHGLTQNTDPALDYYQRALEIKPDSKEVKKNIELLIQQSQQQSSKDGKKSDKKGKSGKEQDDSQEKGADKNQEGKDKDQDEVKGQDEESLKKKNLSKEEINQILKEIKEQESKVRAKENQKNKDQKGKGFGEKTW